MEPLTLDTFRRNAYRVLGLQAGATQEQIDAAARLLRLHSEGDAPPTFNDAAWLGPVTRAPQDVDNAVMRLTDPESRTMERLWWFCNVPPASDSGAMAPISQTAVSKLRHRHDEALTAICRLLIVGASGEALEKWRGLLGEFRAIARSDTYLQWLLEVENDGQFEKQASADEVASLQAQMGGYAATALVKMSNEYLDEGSYVPVGRIVNILQDASGGRPGPAKDAADRIINRLDDALIGRCNECIADVNTAWATKQIRVLKPACVRALHQCQGTIDDLCREILKWSANDPDRGDRVRGQVVSVYAHIADAYEACHDNYSARQTLMKTTELARGTPMEPRLQERIESLTTAQPVRDTVAASGRGGGDGGSGGGGYRDYFSGGGSRWGVIAIVIVLVNVVRLCAHMPGGGSSSTPTDPAVTAQSDALMQDHEFTELLAGSSRAKSSGAPNLDEILTAFKVDSDAHAKPGTGKIHELYMRVRSRVPTAALPERTTQ
ncbi:MAG TPA: hypothetical protein VHM90_10690 [Phycisphaerae bacterium]|nr:hypothetical protein [Phycisphaerae bacterium]